MALLSCFLFSLFSTLAAATQDLHSLLSFKASAGPHRTSLSTWHGEDPCSGAWVGVECDGGRVTSIYLDDASLAGDIAPLLKLSNLRVLSLRRNTFTGPLPQMSNLTSPRLRHLYLSQNQFNGTLFLALPRLLSLRAENNGFSGGLEGLKLPHLQDLNVSENQLSGEIPGGLSKFPDSAFGGNPALCGSPLPSCVKTSQVVLMANNTTSPSPTPQVANSSCSRIAITKLGMVGILAVGIGDTVVIAMALAFVVGLYIWVVRRRGSPLRSSMDTIRGIELDHSVAGERKDSGGGLVQFDRGEELSLECLLKASAEVLGKSVAGSTYKAVLDNGLVVAVKRLNAVRFPASGKAFDRRMHLIGRLRHSNVVSLRAYYNAKEEKLLVYDYMPNGSLHSILHNTDKREERSEGLDWRRRKEILMGAAQGLNFIHTFPSRSPLVHANIKPSNILIDEHGNVCLSEWGLLCSLAAPSALQPSPPHSSRHLFSSTMNPRGYRAPELAEGMATRATQESDVYSFGMVLLEVVTDKDVNEVECDGEVMEMVKIGMMCTTGCPEERPKMTEVIRMIGEML